MLVSENYSDCRFLWYQNIGSASYNFVATRVYFESQYTRLTDGQTDGRTELRQQYRALHYTQSYGKNRIVQLV